MSSSRFPLERCLALFVLGCGDDVAAITEDGSSTGEANTTSEASTSDASTAGEPSGTTAASGSEATGLPTSGAATTGAVGEASTDSGETTAAEATGDGRESSSSTGIEPYCGDAVIDPGETCDDGNLGGCSGACTRKVVELAAGSTYTCARLLDSSIKCWGGNDEYGQLGLGDLEHRGDEPEEMGDKLPFVDLGTGKNVLHLAPASYHSCVLLADDSLKCWGNNAFGQLGIGQPFFQHRGDEPGEMGDMLPAIDLGTGRSAIASAGGSQHNCALLDDGMVKCWGDNSLGMLGLGDQVDRGESAEDMGDNLPALDLGSGSVTQLAVGGFTSCALFADGSVKCWGANVGGSLGQGDLEHRGDDPDEMGDALLPIDLGTGRTATAISAGWMHVCALLDDTSVKCWGNNYYGQLGIGDTDDRGDELGEMGDALPTIDFGTGRTVVAFSVGFAHACALLDDNSLKCWGSNLGGQLGLGTGMTSHRGDAPGEMGDNLPTIDLGTGRTATAVTAGGSWTCALLDDASVKCWGAGGLLGLGDTYNRGEEPGEMGDALPVVSL